MAETEFKHDVFISYSSANKDWVRKDLLSALEKAGLRVCIDFRDFKAGKPAIKNMRDSILESRHTLLVLTEAYLNSGWTDFENLLSQTIDPANRQGRIVPLMKEECKLPLEIGYLTYVNFFDPDDWDIAWKQLFEALGASDKSRLDTLTPDTGTRNNWHLAHPYPMPPNFTGRAAEQTMLDNWLADNTNRLFILRALGGFGKSALTWQWINTHVNPAEWTKLVWWSFYEGDASFEHCIEETLKYLKLDIPQGQRPQVDEVLRTMQSQKILLIMDGFERALRAYSSMNAAYQGDDSPLPVGEGKGEGETNQLDCVNINAEIFLKSVCSLPGIKSKVLMTTRLTPRAIKPRGEYLQGCREEELTAMQKADAVEFFHKQKIKGTHAEIEAACAPYGYHPLSLRLLAGRILKDFEDPADIVVAQKLKIDGDLKQHQHHVMEVSYNSLPHHEQKLLSTIACFRSPVELKTLEAIVENKDSLNDALYDLVERGLLHFDDKNRRFDLHPIVRRYAYERLTAPDRTAAHTRLCDYFAAVDIPDQPQNINDLAPVIELYHHSVRAGNLEEAQQLYTHRLGDPIYYQFAMSGLQIELLRAFFINGEDKPPHLKTKRGQSFIANDLGTAYSLSGQPLHAIRLTQVSAKLNEEENDKKNLAIDLGNIGFRQLHIGYLQASETSLRQSLDLSKEIPEKFWEATAYLHLGQLRSFCSMWTDAEQFLNNATSIFVEREQVHMQSATSAFNTLRILLMNRDTSLSTIGNEKVAIKFARRSLSLAEDFARARFPMEINFVRAHWLLGAAYCLDNQLDLGNHHLSEALTRCRAINNVQQEGDILLNVARLRYNERNYEDAKSLAEEALTITERCGYVLQGADVNLFLAELALTLDPSPLGRGKAREYAETALKLATCDGPPYYYKVAYEEAERFLEKLNKMK